VPSDLAPSLTYLSLIPSVSAAGGATRSPGSPWPRRLLTLVFYALRSENSCESYPVNPTSTVAVRSFAGMASGDGC